MFDIDSDKTISLTRGDVLFFTVSARDKKTKEIYTFQSGDIVRMTVYAKKNSENVVLQKDFPVNTPSQEVEIILGKEDTSIGEYINKAVDYWYDITLNPDTIPQTIIGFSDEGAKIFRLYPKGKEI